MCRQICFHEEVKTRIFWTFELGTQEVINIPLWIFVGFQQRDRQDSQNLINDTVYRPLVTSSQCVIGTAIYPDSANFLNYNDNGDSQGYGQTKEAFRALPKMISLNHINPNMSFDQLIMVMVLVILYTFST